MNFYQYNILFCVRKCRVLSRMSVICGNFWFTSSIRRYMQLRRIDCLYGMYGRYGKAALSERICREWFQKFENGEFYSFTINARFSTKNGGNLFAHPILENPRHVKFQTWSWLAFPFRNIFKLIFLKQTSKLLSVPMTALGSECSKNIFSDGYFPYNFKIHWTTRV